MSAAAIASAQPAAAVLLVDDPDVTARLAAEGADFASELAGRPFDAPSNAALLTNPAYASLVRDVTAEMADQRAEVVAADRPGDAASVRLFEPTWLRSDVARFRLVALVNRFDRRLSGAGPCGEARLLYRLGYAKSTGESSDLPMTAALVFDLPAPAPGGGCAEVVRRSRLPAGLGAAATAAALRRAAGAFASVLRGRSPLKQVEVNLQLSRWPARPAGAGGDFYAGEALYLLKAYRPTPAGLVPEPLENTPDVLRLSREPALRQALRAWLTTPANLAAVDRGTFQLPRAFLARRAVSVSPFGLARPANRLYSAVFADSDFAGVALSRYRTVATPAALLRRLDTATCSGCHQSGSIAGFHFLGRPLPGPAAAGLPDLAEPRSPALAAALPWRAWLLAQSAAGAAAPGPVPTPERDWRRPGRVGMACGLGDPGFAGWTCAPGLSCADAYPRTGHGPVGHCQDLRHAARAVGEACDDSTLAAGKPAHQDRLIAFQAAPCAGAGALCANSVIGFPGGACSIHCDHDVAPDACVKTPVFGPFTACVDAGIAFARCYREQATGALWQRCDASRPCREDYACAAAKAGGTGACVPTYFLQQLTVEHHPALTYR